MKKQKKLCFNRRCLEVVGSPFHLNAILFAGVLWLAPTAVSAGNHAALVPGVQQQSTERTLTGTVVDGTSDEPIIGAVVKIKGAKTGTVTDLDGRFTIKVENRTQLEISSIGYKQKTLLVGDLGVMTVRMDPDDTSLDEVVVVGQGTQKKVSVTGAITTVKGSDLKSPSSSLTSSLAGKLAGLMSYSSSGEPGTTSDFYIRGINTFGGRATPLILLDGIEVSGGDLNLIPAESIESFSLLKDASATAIYGNRGANGVLLVTTKSGFENTKARVSVTLETSYFHPVNRPEFVDGPTYMTNYNEAQAARSTGSVTPFYSDETIAATKAGTNPYVYPNVDWYDEIFKSGNVNQRANISLQGGGSRVTYYMGLQMNHDTGLLNTPKYFYNNNINQYKYNFQNNIAYKVAKGTTLELRMLAQIGNLKGPSQSTSTIYGYIMQTNPVAFPVRFPNEEGDNGYIRFGIADINSTTMGVNPYAQMMSGYTETNSNHLNTSLSLTQDLDFITKGLKVKALVNFKNYSASKYSRSITPYYYKYKAGSYDPVTNTFEQELRQQGDQFVTQSDSPTKEQDQTFYFDARADWKRSFGNHNLTAMAMYMMREYRSSVLPNRNQGYSGRVTYDYKNKYLAEFNFGYNGSERLAKGDRFEFFPAASVGWVVSSEDFFAPLSKVVTFMKLRASYGLVGSDEFNGSANHFLYINAVSLGSGGAGWSGLPGEEVSKSGPSVNILAVENAGWEHVKKLNIGVDLRFFDQLNITFDYFHDKRDKILMARSSWPRVLGYWGSTPWANVGAVTNQGFEFAVNWQKKINRDWRVDTRLNFTYNQNRVDYYDEPDYPYVWQTQTGQPLNRINGYIAEGYFTSQEEIDHHANQTALGSTPMVGDLKYRDVNGDGKITSEDQVMLSPYNSIPRIQYGIGVNVSWKKFDLGMFFNGSAKRYIMINGGIAPFLSTGGDGMNTTLPRNMMQWIADSHWSVDNPDPNALYPRLGTDQTYVAGNLVPSSHWLRCANFLRFKTLELGYSLPIGRIYVSADNLAVWSPFKLWDPELSWNSYPYSTTVNLGVQLTF